MDELNINYSGVSQGRKMTAVITSVYLLIFSCYFAITEAIASNFNILFIAAFIGFVAALVVLLSNTLWLPKWGLTINSTSVNINLPDQNSSIEWTNVSEVNIGTSYVVFMLNGGQKQKKMDVSSLIYSDTILVKGKILEIAQFKSIPYKND